MTPRKINHMLSILLLVLFISSCSETMTEIKPEMENTFQATDSITYLALGDSYTIGQGVDSPDRWPNQLAYKLTNNGNPIKNTKIIARTGWTTTNLLSSINENSLEQYDLVSLLIGVNNQYQRKPFSVFQSEFEELLDKAIELSGSEEKVFVVSIPDYGVTPFGSSNSANIALEIDQYNSHIETRCLEREIPFIDITEISRSMGSSNGALASDNLHPSGEQYRRWTEVIYPEVVDLLNQES